MMLLKWFPALRYAWQLANWLTTLGLLLGWLSLFLFHQRQFRWALLLYAEVLILDRLDGWVARRLKQASSFGKELDSLADHFNFCFIPMVMAYLLGFSSWSAMILLAAFGGAGLWRLAYFNSHEPPRMHDRAVFIGFPTTAIAALFMILTTLFFYFKPITALWYFFPFFLISPWLMLASCRYIKNGWITIILTLLVLMSSGLLMIVPPKTYRSGNLAATPFSHQSH